MTVYTVLWHSDAPGDAYAGAMGDGSFTSRFRRRAEAERFAAGRHYYGQPATVQVDHDVSRRLAARWGL